MLLSTTDKARFKILYNDYTHKELAIIFGTYHRDVVVIAKELGIYVPYNNTTRHGNLGTEETEIENNTTP